MKAKPTPPSPMRLALILALLSTFAGCHELSPKQKAAHEAARRHMVAVSTTGPHVQALAELIDWDRLDALTGERAATPILRKACHRLELARKEGANLTLLIQAAQKKNGNRGTPRADAVALSLNKNHSLLQTMGCFDQSGMAGLKEGRSPAISKGKHFGEMATVDRVVPLSVVPALENRLYNLRFLAESLHPSNEDHITPSELSTADRWFERGLLSKAEIDAVEATYVFQVASEIRRKQRLDR